MVRNRECLIREEEQQEIISFIHQMVIELGHKPLIINGMPEHLHILVEFSPDKSPSETILEIKKASSDFINARMCLSCHFRWQSGYGAFTYSGSQIGKAMEYIRNQKKYHEREKQLADCLASPEISDMTGNGRILFDFTDV